MDHLREKIVKTRKSHKCWGCAEEYPTGSAMLSVTGAEDGTVATTYWCPVCEDYMRNYFEEGDDCEFGEIKKNDPKVWQSIKECMPKSTFTK